MIWRLDVLPLFFTSSCLWYQFGEKLFDREELLPVFCLMAAISIHSLLFFINFWSADANIFISYIRL